MGHPQWSQCPLGHRSVLKDHWSVQAVLKGRRSTRAIHRGHGSVLKGHRSIEATL